MTFVFGLFIRNFFYTYLNYRPILWENLNGMTNLANKPFEKKIKVKNIPISNVS